MRSSYAGHERLVRITCLDGLAQPHFVGNHGTSFFFQNKLDAFHLERGKVFQDALRDLTVHKET